MESFFFLGSSPNPKD